MEIVLLLFPFQRRKRRPRKAKHPALAACTSRKRQRRGLNPDILAAESKIFTTFLAVLILPVSGLLGHSANTHGISTVHQALGRVLRTQQAAGQIRSRPRAAV